MALADPFAAVDAVNHEIVARNTWGHLAPVKHRAFRGYMVFTCAGYGGDIAIIDADWGDLEDSTWLYDAMLEYAGKHAERGKVTRFDGVFRNYRFTGVQTVLSTDLP